MLLLLRMLCVRSIQCSQSHNFETIAKRMRVHDTTTKHNTIHSRDAERVRDNNGNEKKIQRRKQKRQRNKTNVTNFNSIWESGLRKRERLGVCVCEWVYEHCVTARMGISVSCYYQAMSQQYAAQMNVFVPVYGCFGCFWMQNTLHTEAKSFEVGVGCCGTVCVCICCTFCISLTPDSSL